MSEIELRASPGRRPLSDLNASNDPLSPTANLKLLTKVASNFEKQHIGNIVQKSLTNGPLLKEYIEIGSTNGGPKSRKDKSLSLLCDRFLKLFPLGILPGDHMVICIDQAAKELGTERRRIYDIINVLESLEMASKVGKNRYMWYGTQQLPNTLAKLKGLALHLKLHEQIQSLRRLNSNAFRIITDCTGTTEVVVESRKGIRTHIVYPPNQSPVESSMSLRNSHVKPTDCVTNDSTSSQNVQSICGINTPTVKAVAAGDISLNLESFSENASCKEEKSLGVMCQKFMMLFLISHETDALNLDLAAKILMSDASSERKLDKSDEKFQCCELNKGDSKGCQPVCNSTTRKLKTKVRRLYDIANVLTSLGLICKIQNHENSIRKPAFRYTGPLVEPVIFMDEEIKLCQMSRHSLLRSTGPLYDAELKTAPYEEYFPENYVDNGVILMSPTPKRRRKTSTTSSTECSENQSFTSGKPLSRHNSSSNDSLTDILQVAEIELKRLKSLETPSPTERLPEKRTVGAARKKLFPISNIDSCTEQSQVKSDKNKSDQNVSSNSNTKKTCNGNGKAKNMIKVTRKLVKVIPTATQQFQPSPENGLCSSKPPDGQEPVFTVGVPLFAVTSNVNEVTKDIAQDLNVPEGKQWNFSNASSSKLNSNSLITSAELTKNHVVHNTCHIQPSSKKSSIYVSQNSVFHSSSLQYYVVPSNLSSIPVLGKIVDSRSSNEVNGVKKSLLSSGKIFTAVKVGGTIKLVPVCNNPSFISPCL
ncbi:transcription factor E2F8 [Anabrus simplex]|uniref:transcription factor E2F8 n=1 Tax=Anabrus simplex TaxID=316456 RepID=UPI0035A31D1C